MDIFQKGDLSVADEILSPDFVWRNPSIPSDLRHGSDGTKKLASSIIDGMPDRKFTHDDVVAEGDKVAVSINVTGTYKGEFQGIPPTGKQVSFTAMDVLTIIDGKITEEWATADMMGLMQQIGAIPARSATSSNSSDTA